MWPEAEEALGSLKPNRGRGKHAGGDPGTAVVGPRAPRRRLKAERAAFMT